MSRRLVGWALQDLSSEVSGERHDLASYEAVAMLVTEGAQRWAVEQGSQVECGQGVEDDDLVGSIGVDG